MIPSALAAQLRKGLADFLRFSFWSSTPGMERVVDDLLHQDSALLRGPYVSLQLPFVAGTDPRTFPEIPLDFVPHAYQEQVFERLRGRRKRSTLVATGTGSGKTEAFLVPILDHCRAAQGTPGVKAILIYPMNALATDQAGRIARLVHDTPSLRGRVRAGLFIGDDRRGKAHGEPRMGPDTVITDREAMREQPPDILLTNYKMLDYLLLRSRDQGIWRANGPGVLRFLVVDELHTFDGAQGTDLACLVRRLKRRLHADGGSLCCVGTSATLGGSEAGEALRRYAKKVFGEPFDESSVVGESRQGPEAWLDDTPPTWDPAPGPADKAALDPARHPDAGAWLRQQVALWFGEVHSAESEAAWAVELGRRLRAHTDVQSLLMALGGRLRSLDALVAELARGRSAWRRDPELGRLAVTSLLALVSVARAWRRELPEVAQRRRDEGLPRPAEPLLALRVQLWQRELRRMVATVAPRPRLRHADDLEREARQRHLPLIHCRECGAMGWVTRVDRDRPHLYRTDLNSVYRGFFSKDAQVAFLYPSAAVPDRGAGGFSAPFRLDTDRLVRLAPDEPAEGGELELVTADNVRSTTRGPELSRDCPFCAARDSVAIVGFRAATLTSVYIDQLYASRYNDDKKLLTFSDSVQDAAHRAGFFGARTWRTNLRVAMVGVLRDQGDLPLARLAAEVGPTWRKRLSTEAWIATFLAPNMAWLHDWGALRRQGALPPGSDLPHLVARRLSYEVYTELGLQAGVGRSLVRTGVAAVDPEPERVEQAVERLVPILQNEVPGLGGVGENTVRGFVVGLLHHLRTRGGILSDTLPRPYLASGGGDIHAFKREKYLPVYGRTSRLPVFLSDRRGTDRFETWRGSGRVGWYDRWVDRCFRADGPLGPDPASLYPVVLPLLVREGLLTRVEDRKGGGVYGLDPTALRVSAEVAAVVCRDCGHRLHVTAAAAPGWAAAPCLTARCPGAYRAAGTPETDYFGRLYARGDLQRIFAEEHTGLLDRGERERVEREFKAPAGPAWDPDTRRPWFANLLSCTPTLEMGIDIGDLSAGVLCSVPPAQTHYVQRVGRAGRRDGNAFILAVANSRPHDLYFFAEPTEMMEGEIAPPGVFLDAPAVLRRQLTAFCLDRWVATQGAEAQVPPRLRTVLAAARKEDPDRFPHDLLRFVRGRRETLLREFREMFEGELGSATVASLHDFLFAPEGGARTLQWSVLDAIDRERRQRDALRRAARKLREQIRKLERTEARSKDHNEELARLETEKSALLALVNGINRKHTLEFLTNEGLLPNYAFPESAVSLRSVIWRKKKQPPAQGSKYETWSYDYRRAPVSALSELAPHADFYAGGRRVRVDQVDLSVSGLETWRFCSACDHAQRVDTGDDALACPQCGDRNWVDDGQRFQMLELRQVFARAPDRESRIRDDRDDRQPRYFNRSTLFGFDKRHHRGAWRIDREKTPFGFEYIERATLREVNFGERTDQGPVSVIGGREAVRPGFEICARCGKVQRPGQSPDHALSCPLRNTGGEEDRVRCLYLYREFRSEALRLLLPIADTGATRQLHSFMAALQVGLRERFGGSVDHLRTMVYSEPQPESALRRQYLVLYDMVPGGTSYLEQLVLPSGEGRTRPLFEALELALRRIERCPCWSDPERDGCYRCLYAYRNARDMDDTSAQEASRLLRAILEGQDDLVPVEDGLHNVSIDGLLDSVLEERFVEALRQMEGPDGRAVSFRRVPIRGRPGYRIGVGDQEWIVEPQVEPPPTETAGVPVSIDFVLRPARPDPDREIPHIAVFLDGWVYHRHRVDHDWRQRMALLATGRYDVWTFNWYDIDHALAVPSSERPPDLLGVDRGALATLARKTRLNLPADLLDEPTFTWFRRELAGEALRWDQLAKVLIAARTAHADPRSHETWAAFARQVAPDPARDGLAALKPQLLVLDDRERHPLFRWAAAYEGGTSALLCELDDEPAHYESPEYRAAWWGAMRLFQLLRHAEGAWFMTRTAHRGDTGYRDIAAAREGPGVATWADDPDLDPDFRGLARALVEAGAPDPAIGVELYDARGSVWAEAELAWEPARVAVLAAGADRDTRTEAPASWTVLHQDALGDDPQPVLAALEASEET